MIEPPFIVLATREARQRFEEHMVQVDNHDYDMNMLAGYLIDALQVRKYCEENVQTMLEYFCSQFQGSDQATARRALIPLLDAIYEQLMPLALWDNSGELHYQFHRWLGYDIVIAHTPLALPAPQA